MQKFILVGTGALQRQGPKKQVKRKEEKTDRMLLLYKVTRLSDK